MRQTVISSFQKNNLEDIRVQIREFKGRDEVDVRVYSSLEAGGEKLPTGKGFSLEPSQLEQFRRIIEEVSEALKRRPSV